MYPQHTHMDRHNINVACIPNVPTWSDITSILHLSLTSLSPQVPGTCGCYRRASASPAKRRSRCRYVGGRVAADGENRSTINGSSNGSIDGLIDGLINDGVNGLINDEIYDLINDGIYGLTNGYINGRAQKVHHMYRHKCLRAMLRSPPQQPCSTYTPVLAEQRSAQQPAAAMQHIQTCGGRAPVCTAACSIYTPVVAGYRSAQQPCNSSAAHDTHLWWQGTGLHSSHAAAVQHIHTCAGRAPVCTAACSSSAARL
jgi:hypothetical protein